MLQLATGFNKRKVYRDGGDVTHPVFMPQSALDFTLLGITAPNSLWLCQEAAGNLADSIGAITLTSNLLAYQAAVAGWNKVALAFNQTASQRSQVAAGTYDPASTSVAWLVYFKLTATPGGTRKFLTACDGLTTTGVQISILATEKLQLHCVNVTNATTDGYNDGRVHPALLVYNRTASAVNLFTDLQQVTGTYNSGAVDTAKGFGAAASGTAFPGNILWGCCASGATAEGYGKATLQKLGWTLSY